MLDSDGHYATDRQAIADAFASFYEDLYRNRQNEPEMPNVIDVASPDLFTMCELVSAIRLLPNGKAKDDSGVFSELIRTGTQTLRDMILDLINDILSLRAFPPESWKRSRFSVILKKGDAALPGK